MVHVVGLRFRAPTSVTVTQGQDEPDGSFARSWFARATPAWIAGGLFAVAVLATFWSIHRYAVNTIFADNWADVNLLGRLNSGTLSFGNLWAQHGENRIFLPNLVVLMLGRTVHFNIVDEDFLSGILLTATCGLVIWAHKRRSPTTPWLWYIPVAFTILSLNQGTMTLWGFAVSWYLEIFFLVLSVFLLDRPALSRPILAGAIAAGAAGSFSSLEGLLVWPVGLLLLYHRSRGGRAIGAWIVSALVVTILYFYRFDFSLTASDNGYDLHHPVVAVRFFFFAMGNVLGVSIPSTPSPADYLVLAVGVAIFAVACWVLIIGIPRPVEQSGSSIGVALVLFGMLYTLGLTQGRAGFGLPALPRYAIFDLLLLAGCYLAVIDGTLLRKRPRPSRWSQKVSPRGPMRRGDGQRQFLLPLVVLGLIALQICLGTSEAVGAADVWHSHELVAADVTANINDAPNALVQQSMGSLYQRAGFIRRMAEVARDDRLSLFGTGLAAEFRHQGLTVDRLPPTTEVLTPKSGAIARGIQILGAQASQQYGVTRVTFAVTDRSGNRVFVGNASLTYYGWIDLWNSNTVPDGSYVVRSTAYDAIGNHATSAPVSFRVHN